MSDYYVLGQGKVFLDEIDPITKRAKEKSRYVGNVPEDGFIIAPQTQTLEHFESNTGFNRRDQKFDSKEKRNLIEKQLKNSNIETRRWWPKPLSQMPAFRRERIESIHEINSSYLADTTLGLPFHPGIS